MSFTPLGFNKEAVRYYLKFMNPEFPVDAFINLLDANPSLSFKASEFVVDQAVKAKSPELAIYAGILTGMSVICGCNDPAFVTAIQQGATDWQTSNIVNKATKGKVTQ